MEYDLIGGALKDARELLAKIDHSKIGIYEALKQVHVQISDQLRPRIKHFDVDLLSNCEFIGEGAFSQVYRCMYNGQHVAVKFSDDLLAACKEVYILQYMSKLHFVPKVIDFGITSTLISLNFRDRILPIKPGTFVLVMTYIQVEDTFFTIESRSNQDLSMDIYNITQLEMYKIMIHDFGGDNILFDEHGKMWIIDFNASYIYGDPYFDYVVSDQYLYNTISGEEFPQTLNESIKQYLFSYNRKFQFVDDDKLMIFYRKFSKEIKKKEQ